MSAGKVLAGLAMGLGGGTGLGAWWAQRRAGRVARGNPALEQAVAGGAQERLARASADFTQAEARVEQQLRAGNWTQATLDLVSMAKAHARVQERWQAVNGLTVPPGLPEARLRLDRRMRQVGTRSLTPPNIYGLNEQGEP